MHAVISLDSRRACVVVTCVEDSISLPGRRKPSMETLAVQEERQDRISMWGVTMTEPMADFSCYYIFRWFLPHIACRGELRA